MTGHLLVALTAPHSMALTVLSAKTMHFIMEVVIAVSPLLLHNIAVLVQDSNLSIKAVSNVLA
jgi:hypothetical protein